MTRPLLLCALLLAAASAAANAPAGAQSAASPTMRDGHKDFDFLLGTWQTRYRILKERLRGSHEWYGCSGASVVRTFWKGYGNLEDGDLRCPGSHVIGMTLRLYNPATRQWSLWWGTRKLGLVPPPQVGHFTNRVGDFYAPDTSNGTPVIVRFRWNEPVPGHPRFEQAFSTDGGRSWEVTRISDGAFMPVYRAEAGGRFYRSQAWQNADGSQELRIETSSDFGDTWTSLLKETFQGSGEFPTPIAISAGASEVAVLTHWCMADCDDFTGSTVLYLSKDGGKTWTHSAIP